MSLDPYPDLPDGAQPGAGGAGGRAELSEADSRLLDALSRPEPPVVTAVEDQPRTAQDDRATPMSVSGGRGPLAPVFREPTD